MKKLYTRKSKFSFVLTISLIVLSIIFFLLRGPYLSNSIKRMIIPVLENVTRERIIIDKAVINLFPFYVQAKGVKVFDAEGNRLLWITKTRVYIDLLGLLSKEIRIRMITMIEPDIDADKKDIGRIIDNVNKFLSTGEKEDYTVTLKNMKITDGNVKLSDEDESLSISGKGLFLNAVYRRGSYLVDLSMKNGTAKMPDGSELPGTLSGKIKMDNNRVTVSAIDVSSAASLLSARGEIVFAPDWKIKDGTISGKAKIDVDLINKLFILKQIKEGMLTFDGSVKLFESKESKWPGITFDLKTDSRFHLETLMELIKVEENITGQLTVDGRITGTFPDLEGRGTVKLEDAVFDTFPIDNAGGRIRYKDNKFTLHDVLAHTYGGKLEGSADILIPDGDYSVTAAFADISSPEFFKFIRWEPPFQKGRIKGNVQLNQEYGRDIEVKADVSYKNTSKSGNEIMGRLDSITGSLALREDTLTLNNTMFSTSESILHLDGRLDLKRETLDLDMRLESKNTSDLTAPYYDKFIAPLRFTGTASGPFNDTEIAGIIEADNGSVHGLEFKKASADLKYKIRSLKVDHLRIEQETAVYDAAGSIDFRKATDLFSFKDPFYTAEASFNNVNIMSLIKAAHSDIPAAGAADGKISFKGSEDKYKASSKMALKNSEIYGQLLDKVDIEMTIIPNKIEFSSINAYRGESKIYAKGNLFFNNKYELSASSDKIKTEDIQAWKNNYVDAVFDLNMRGAGTLDNPEMIFSMNIAESSFRGNPAGKGMITGSLKGDKLQAGASLDNGTITAEAKADLKDDISWDLALDFHKGEYDYLFSAFLPESPRDLSALIEGRADIKGRGKKFSLHSKLKSVEIEMYGFNLRNEGDIELGFLDNKLMLTALSMKGNQTNINLKGDITFGEKYNLEVKGAMGIEPLNALSDKIVSLKGNSAFNVGISGTWEKPEIAGEITLKDASANLSDFSYRIGPVNGKLFFKTDRITFDSINAGFAGGNIVLSGVAYLDKLSLKRLYVSSLLSGIKIRPIEGGSVDINGKLYYEKSQRGSSLSGDIDIKKAKYEKKIEWKSLLTGMNEMKEKSGNYPQFLKETELKIRIVSNNFFINNNIARTPVKLALNLTGTVAELGIIGRIEADTGSIYFRRNEFKILKGTSVDFVKPDSIEPFFHILADTYASDYYIKLAMDGTIDNFSLSLFAEPPLSESEILSLLTFGQLGKEARGFESGMAASEAVSLLTGTLTENVEDQFKDITGFERFEIEPHTTREGAFSPKITISKRLFEDKIFVTYSSSVGTVEEQIIKIEYKLTDNLSLLGSRDEIGSTGADFKYRFEFK